MLKEAQYPCWGFTGQQFLEENGIDTPHLNFPEFNKVAYVVIDDCCYFTGVDTELRTSTINAAESIIVAIAKQEGIDPLKYRWFDLQTSRGYGHNQPFNLDGRWSPYGDVPGLYDFDELLIAPTCREPQKAGAYGIQFEGFKGETHEAVMVVTADQHDFTVSWQSTVLSPNIRELFREYIGEPPLPVMKAREARRQGFRPYYRKVTELCGCLLDVHLAQCVHDPKPEFVLVDQGREKPQTKVSRAWAGDEKQYALWCKPSPGKMQYARD